MGGTRTSPRATPRTRLEELGEGAILGQVAARAAAEPLGEHTLVALVGEHDYATLRCVVSQHAARRAPGEPRQAGAEQDDGRAGLGRPGDGRLRIVCFADDDEVRLAVDALPEHLPVELVLDRDEYASLRLSPHLPRACLVRLY